MLHTVEGGGGGGLQGATRGQVLLGKERKQRWEQTLSKEEAEMQAWGQGGVFTTIAVHQSGFFRETEPIRYIYIDTQKEIPYEESNHVIMEAEKSKICYL